VSCVCPLEPCNKSLSCIIIDAAAVAHEQVAGLGRLSERGAYVVMVAVNLRLDLKDLRVMS
jgi:hypothetical protein